jgi:hypothetical protein
MGTLSWDQFGPASVEYAMFAEFVRSVWSTRTILAA